ncbi:hypothetical protein ABZ832_07350 [Streptantibioticus parmotrematis]|uniref:hypothetical protein n=1 Tax=Streptantibioticus parmotrematis TaxID=2873249 RepID=UPI00340B655D
MVEQRADGAGARRAGARAGVARARIREAVEAKEVLAEALRGAGISLPALGVRTPSSVEEDRARYALVHLGVCAAPVARALAEVIAKGVRA